MILLMSLSLPLLISLLAPLLLLSLSVIIDIIAITIIFIFPESTWSLLHDLITSCMMTSSNGNIIRVAGHFSKASDAELWCFLFDLRLNKRLSKQSWGWWLETPSRPLWRHCNMYQLTLMTYFIVGWARASPQNVDDYVHGKPVTRPYLSLIAKFMGLTWGRPGSDRTQVGPCWPHELCYLGIIAHGSNYYLA